MSRKDRQQPGAWAPIQPFRPEGVSTIERISEQEVRLRALHEKMNGWNEYVREMRVLPDVAPALSTGRPELLALMSPRPLTEEECRVLFDMLAVLIETNQALRMHSELLAQIAEQQAQLVHGAAKKLDQMIDYANFREPRSDDPDEE